MEDAAPLTRRELRSRGAEATPEAAPTSEAAPEPDAAPEPRPSRLNEPSPLPTAVPARDAADPDDWFTAATSASAPAPAPSPAAALTWVDPDALRPEPARAQASADDLLPPLRRARRRVSGRAVAVPAIAVLLLAVVYAAAMLLWPLASVEPAVAATEVDALAAAESDVDWPGAGTGAVSVSGFTPAASTGDADQLASITKVVTALVVLDAATLEAGEQGPAYEFTFADRSEYWSYVSSNQSALNVPDGGSLTQYQMLQGMLIASASNYADRLASEVFGSVEEYTTAANAWLAENGLDDVTVTDASGFDRGNEATPAAMITLAEKALANPVIAEIVAQPEAELPGAGAFQNTNALLADPDVIGLKTGSYTGFYNLLAARTATVGDAEVTLLAAVTGQPSDDLRETEAERLLDEVADELTGPTALAAGTVVGSVSTAWGASSDVVTDAEASVLLWNGATAKTDAAMALGDERAAGADAGTLTLSGPVDSAEVGLELASAVPGPDAWWRLTHPLELLGLAG